MLKKLLILFLIPALIFAQVKNNKDNKLKPVYQDKLYYKFSSIMLNELEKNSYKPPAESVFIEKVYNYFGIDITKSKFDDVLCENNNYLYSILKKEKFADFIQIDRDFEKEADEVLKDIFTTNSVAKKEFIEFNKILFNDNIESIKAVLNDEEIINLLVLYYDYENDDLIKRFIIKLAG